MGKYRGLQRPLYSTDKLIFSMIKIPEKIPDGMKYFNYVYEYRGQVCGGGFVGDDPEAVFDTEPLRSRSGEVQDVNVKEVSREEFIKSLEERQAGPHAKNLRYFDPGFWEDMK